MNTTLSVSKNILRTDDGGVWRIGRSRVSLDSVIFAFNEGASAEEIVFRFSTLDLEQVYSAISYYLQHRQKVENYLKKRDVERAKVRLKLESQFDQKGIRERLLSRRNDEVSHRRGFRRQNLSGFITAFAKR